jgi:putative flippase GtrA
LGGPARRPGRRAPIAGRLPALAVALLARRARIVRFCLTGGAAALLQLALLTAFERLAWPPLLANGSAFALSAQFNFGASQAFTWGDRSRTGGLIGRWLRYHGTIAGSALLNMAVFAAASQALPSPAAAALGIAAAAAINFLSGDRLVFRAVGRAPAHPTATVALAVGGAPDGAAPRRGRQLA